MVVVMATSEPGSLPCRVMTTLPRAGHVPALVSARTRALTDALTCIVAHAPMWVHAGVSQ